MLKQLQISKDLFSIIPLSVSKIPKQKIILKTKIQSINQTAFPAWNYFYFFLTGNGTHCSENFKKVNQSVCSISVAMLSGLRQNKQQILEQFFIFLFLDALSLRDLSTLNIYLVMEWLDNGSSACALMRHPAVQWVGSCLKACAAYLDDLSKRQIDLSVCIWLLNPRQKPGNPMEYQV